jgi:UDP-N-acetylglucosamine:LPS N-acetylglucosamine transferase
MKARLGKHLKLVAGASTGGHVNELLILLEAARAVWPQMPVAYITTMQIGVKSFASFGVPVYVLGEADRTKPLQSLMVFWRAFCTALVLRPDVVVTTGSMPLALFSLWAWLFGARIVWIDSVAQVERMSVSGRLAKRFASLCLVQWPEVSEKQSGVEYAGELF